jgi:hypothetical protein
MFAKYVLDSFDFITATCIFIFFLVLWQYIYSLFFLLKGVIYFLDLGTQKFWLQLYSTCSQVVEQEGIDSDGSDDTVLWVNDHHNNFGDKSILAFQSGMFFWHENYFRYYSHFDRVGKRCNLLPPESTLQSHNFDICSYIPASTDFECLAEREAGQYYIWLVISSLMLSDYWIRACDFLLNVHLLELCHIELYDKFFNE